MKNKLFTLSLLAASLFFSEACLAGGGELVKSRVQDLTTLAPSGVNAAADYVPVYDASARSVKKVLAENVAAYKAPVTLATDTTLTAAHCGKTILMSGAGSQRSFTLPAATGTGCKITFRVLAVNTSNYVIARAGSDVFKGGLSYFSDNASNATVEFATQSATAVTLNGTTKGGAGIGDTVIVEDIAAATWAVSGQVTESGSEATPFS